MIDPTPAKPPLAPDPADSPESNTQFVVALAIVAAMTALGIGLIVAGLISGKWESLSGGIS